MHYWNKANFQGLLAVADSLEAYPELKPLANYCRYREQGLRRAAFAELEAFLAASRCFDSATARSAAVEVLEADMRTLGAHQFMTQPLIARFLVPTLKAWMEEDTEASLPVRWLGMLERDAELLNRALAACPEDMPVRKILIDFALGWVDHATHHLDESVFLGSPEEATLALERAKALIAQAPEPEALAYLNDEVRCFECLVADWEAYVQAPEGSFTQWCCKRGRSYRMPVKVYYER